MSQKSVFLLQDIVDNKDKGTFLDITKRYVGLDFWESSAEYFYKSHQKKNQYQQNVGWLLQKLNVLKPKTILDLGCGFGRLLPFMYDGMGEKPEKIIGADFCQKMIEYSKDYLKDYEHKDKLKVVMVDGRSIPYKNDEFDCVVTDALFSHLKFSDAQKVANEIGRVTSKYVVTMERYIFDGEHPEPHVYSWDINKFFRFRVLERKAIGPGIVGTVLEMKG